MDKNVPESPLITLNSVEGQKLLKDCSNPVLGLNQPILSHIFSKQSTIGGCGIQTAALLLSANFIGQKNGGEFVNQSQESLHSTGTTTSHSSIRSTQAQKINSTPYQILASGSSSTTSSSKSVVTTRPENVKTIPANQTDFVTSSTTSVNDSASRKESINTGYDATDKTASSDFVAGMLPAGRPDSQRGLPYTEASLYDHPATLKVTSKEITSRRGATLGQIGEILRQHGCKVRVVHASDSDVMKFRHDVIEALSSVNSVTGISVNFARSLLWAGAMGVHHSPLAAYHRPTDRVLVLDTAPAYLEFWVKVSDLFIAMNTLDRSSGMSRGYCVISKVVPTSSRLNNNENVSIRMVESRDAAGRTQSDAAGRIQDNAGRN